MQENSKDEYLRTAKEYLLNKIGGTLIKSPLILKRNFCENLEDLLVDIINTDMYLDWTLSEVK